MRLLAILLLLVSSALASVSVSPTTISTRMRWSNPSGSPQAGSLFYTGTTITVSGSNCTGGAPCTWAIKDGNGTTITTLSSSGGSSSSTGLFGQVDCTGSAANTTCVYNAPPDYPSTQTATINVSDGTTNANVAVSWIFIGQLNEWFAHRGRWTYMNNKPNTATSSGSPLVYQGEYLRYHSIDVPGMDAAFIAAPAAGGTGFPETAGSNINRPTWSYDGKWFFWRFYECLTATYCSSGSSYFMVAKSDGSSRQLVGSGTLYTPLMWAYFKPNWLIGSDDTTVRIMDVDSSTSTWTTVNTYTGTKRSQFSQPSGWTHLFKWANPSQGTCTPGNACTPVVYMYDFSGCSGGLSGSCATVGNTWTLYRNLSTGYEEDGDQHCQVPGDATGGTACEYRVHDLYMQRDGSLRTIFNYGSLGSAGESIFYITNSDGTNTTPFYPVQSSERPYMSHPALDWTGNLIAYGGRQTCGTVGNTCTNNTYGDGVWDLRKNTAITFSTDSGFGHAGWDGFNQNQFSYSWGGAVGGERHRGLKVFDTIPSHGGENHLVIDLQNRPVNTSGDSASSYFYSPTQSPDATKNAIASPISNTINLQNMGWLAYNATPLPPLTLRLSSSSSAQLSWRPNPLNRETQKYWVFKQASCSGSWTRLTSVNAVYLQSTEYTYTDSALSDGQNACYGIASQEWSTFESDSLSNVIQISNTTGTFSAGGTVRAAGTVKFDSTAPSDATSVTTTQMTIASPAAPGSTSQGSGGSLADGTYYFRVVYCVYTDYPANATKACTTTGSLRSGTVTSGGGTASLTFTTSSEMQGQMAVEVYGGGPSGSEPALKLQTCNGKASTFPMTYWPNGFGSAFDCQINSINTGSASPPGSNTAVYGYRVNWTASSSTDVAYYAIYYSDSSAPPINSLTTDASKLNAQKFLVATVPASAASYIDYGINLATSQPYYGIVAVDYQGNYSTGVCRRVNPDTSVSCN